MNQSKAGTKEKENDARMLAPSRNLQIQGKVVDAVRIAAAYRSMRIQDYVALVLYESAQKDIAESHKRWADAPPKG